MPRFYDSDDDDLIVVKEKPNTPSPQKQLGGASSSDSDSSLDDQPAKKRVRCTRSRQTASTEKKEIEDEDVFAKKIDQTFAVLKSTKKKDLELLAAEEEEPPITRRRGRRKVLRTPSPPKEPDKIVDVTDEVLFSPMAMNVSTISISPPVSPSPLAKKKKKRNTKAVKKLNKAIEIISKANEIIRPVDLRSHAKPSDVIVLDSSPAPAEDRSITVRIRSRSGIQRLSMPINRSFASAIMTMARHENVPETSIQLYFNDQMIEPFNTPAQIGIGIADFIECLIHRPGAAKKLVLDDPNALRLKVQSNASKTHTVISIRKDEPLGRMMQKYCESVGSPFESLRFQFDGEDISPNDTAEDLDLETDYCIDVM